MKSNSKLIALVKELVQQNTEQVLNCRRHLHANPELGGRELDTSNYLMSALQELGLEPSKVTGTGVTALIVGQLGPGPTVALRADMDALPIEEETGLPFQSTKHGLMHACGHDAHMAILLGAARVLVQLRDQYAGQVKLIFQPCEEIPPGGAVDMIEAGVLTEPKVDKIFALHVNPSLPAGSIGLRAGVMMAAADNFTLTIIGSGGHGAAPQQTVDPIVTAAHVITGLQAIVSRCIDPAESAVVTIGKIVGGTAHNIIPNQVELSGTCRSLNEQTRFRLKELVEQIAANTTMAFGANYQLDYQLGYPPVMNNDNLVTMVKESGQMLGGLAKVIELKAPFMGGEDFAYYSQSCPGVFVHLGVGYPENETKANYPLHHPRFMVNETALPVGVELMVVTALRALKKQQI